MLGKTTSLTLPHRLASYYLLFGVSAIAWLVVGLVITTRELTTNQTESAIITLLGKAAATVQAEYQRFGESGLQTQVQRIRTQSSLLYSAVVSMEGRFLAHSSADRVGQLASEPTGAREFWGEVQRVRFIDESSRTILEYSVPLKRGGKTIGTLQIGVLEQNLWGTVCLAAQHAPLSILGPLALTVFGALVMRRLVQPISELDSQLQKLATSPVIPVAELKPIKVQSPSALGWNRIIEELKRCDSLTGLDSRLGKGLDTVRHGQTNHILNSLSDGIAVTDEDCRITLSNQSLGAILGTNGASLLGQNMLECVASESQRDRAASLLEPNHSARTVVAELGKSGDMSQGVLRVARHPLRTDNGGQTSGFVWTVRDITQQKLADQMRNQFVYSATHELRTPLANIKAYAETLARSEAMDVEKQKEFCNIINSEAHRLARFIDDLLTISRMEAGALLLERHETDLQHILQETVEKCRAQMDQKRVTFQTELPPKLPELHLDKDKFVVVLVNLIGNAAKYTPEGGTVTVQVEARDGQIQIHVMDTGIGISVEELPRVFEKFFRSSDPRVQEQTGSGLGLSLAAEIVRLHGGRIAVHSEINKGTKFTVVLPTQ